MDASFSFPKGLLTKWQASADRQNNAVDTGIDSAQKAYDILLDAREFSGMYDVGRGKDGFDFRFRRVFFIEPNTKGASI